MVPENWKAGGGASQVASVFFPALAFLIFALGACAPSSRVAGPPPTPQVHVVVIEKFKFVPATPSLRPGDRVRWENRDIVPHQIAESSLRKWKSPDMKPGESFLLEVKETASYLCVLHPTMEGRIEVTSG